MIAVLSTEALFVWELSRARFRASISPFAFITDAGYQRSDSKWSHTTLTLILILALLQPEVEVTPNQTITISLRHSFRQRRANFKEAEVPLHPAPTAHHI